MPYVCIHHSVSSLCVLHKKTTFVPRLYDAVEKGRGVQLYQNVQNFWKISKIWEVFLKFSLVMKQTVLYKNANQNDNLSICQFDSASP